MIYGAGNAIMDITARVSDAFLVRNGVEKGMMALVGLDQSEAVMSGLSAEGVAMTLSAGGSVANTIAGIAALGDHRTALVFRVGDDALGEAFMTETAASGTVFDRECCVVPGATGRSLILVTPDGERSMLTHLGVSSDFSVANIDQGVVRAARLGFIEGYLFDTEPGRDAVRALTAISHEIAITLSDPNCVRRNHDAFVEAVRRSGIVLGNAKEMAAFSGATAEDGVIQCVLAGAVAVCTRSAEPVLIGHGPLHFSQVPVPRVEAVVDTTGAGDQFAAGFLDGFLSNLPLDEAAARGAEQAARVIQHAGARPPVPAGIAEERADL